MHFEVRGRFLLPIFHTVD